MSANLFVHFVTSSQNSQRNNQLYGITLKTKVLLWIGRLVSNKIVIFQLRDK